MNHKLSSFLWYSTIVLTLLLAFIGVSVLATADAPDVYLPIITSDSSLSATVFATNGTATMDLKVIDGRLHVSDSVHGVKNLRILESMLVNRLKGYNGKEVMLYHVNDAGVKDSSRLVPIQSDGTWTYFYDVEFSEVIIDGFVGTWEVTAYNLSVSDSLNFGQTFNASNVTSLPVNATDDATKAHPYDINTTGLISEYRFNDYNDSSGNNYNTSIHSGLPNLTYGKYDSGVDINNSVLRIDGYPSSHNVITVMAWVYPTENTGSSDAAIINNMGINHFMQLDLSTGKLEVYIYGVSSPGYHQTDNTIPLEQWSHVGFTYDNESIKLYVNGDNVKSFSSSGIPSKSSTAYISGAGREFYGIIDNVLTYNHNLNEQQFKNHYLDHLQQLKIKTNSNSTWSSEWNSPADNPIHAIYGDGELISLLNFTVPETVIQNGITIYDYPSTVQFDAIATVGYTEDITKITESAAAGTYTLNVTHAANNTGEGYINYTTANSVLLDADFWNAATLTSDNPNASLSTTLPHFNISTGYIAAATEYYYLVEQNYFYPPTNIQTTPSQTSVYIEWDAVPNADNYSVYELEDGFPYVNTNPIVDGVKDAIYDYAHEFLIFSPNPVNPGDYGTIYPVRTSLGAYLLIECVDNDNKLGDDDTIYYFDLDNDGLTIDDPAWKITNNVVKKYEWDGASWKVTGVSNAVGASTGGGTLYPIHELFIPIAELGANWTNGSTVKVLVKREDSALSPDVITWYPYGNINNTDTALWQEMVLNDPDSYTWLANTTNLWYNATGLTPFTIYHGGVSAWNGSQETSYGLFDVITEDTPTYNASGYIFDSLGYPIAGATVYSCNGFVVEITTSNASGYWIGYNFRNNTYNICANATNAIENSISVTVSGANLTNQNITLNYYNFSYTGISCVSPIYPDETSTVWVDVTDPDGTIQSVTVKIDGTNYSMHVVDGNQWGYVYSDTSEIKKHYITNFYAWDDQGQINSTTSTLYIDVTTAVPSGARGIVYEVEPELELIPVTVIGDERAKFVINLAGLYDFIIGDEPSEFIQWISEWLQGISDYTLVQHINEVGESKPFWYVVGCLSLGMFLSGVTDKNPKIKAKPAATIGFVGILISSIYLGLFAIVI